MDRFRWDLSSGVPTRHRHVFLELAPSGFVYQFGERNAALHPLAFHFGFSGEVAHRTIVRVVVSLIPFEVDAEYRTFAIFHCHEAFELQSQFEVGVSVGRKAVSMPHTAPFCNWPHQ